MYYVHRLDIYLSKTSKVKKQLTYTWLYIEYFLNVLEIVLDSEKAD
jgi:hypothetical protein